MSGSARFNKSLLFSLIKDGERITVRDSEVLGLKFKVGLKRSVFVFEKRISGRYAPPITITIGAFPAISIEDARHEARRLATLCEKGEDPRRSHGKSCPSTLLFGTAVEKFLEVKKDIRPGTLRKYRDIIRIHFPNGWWNLDFNDITSKMVVEAFERSRKSTKEACWEFLKVITNVWFTCRPFFKDRNGKSILKENPVKEARKKLKHIKRTPPKRLVIAKHDLGKFVSCCC